MKFSYKIKESTGIRSGQIEISSREAAIDQLQSGGAQVLSIVEEKGPLEINIPFIDKMLQKVKLNEKVLFAKNLNGMVKAGVPLYKALGVVEKQTKNKYFKKILNDIMEGINKGGTLSSGLSKYPKDFSTLFVSMIQAGEESGNMTGALGEIGFSLEKLYKLKKKVKGAMVYPSVIMGAMVIVGILMFMFVVPNLISMFEGIEGGLPASTQIIVWFSNSLQENAFLVFLGMGLIIGGIIYVVRSPWSKKYIDWTVLKLPAIKKIVRQMSTARTARTLSSLLSSGVSLVRALEITEQVVQNFYFKEVLAKAREGITQGKSFSQTIREAEQVYPVMFNEMIEVGEETGELSQMLLDVASFYESEVDQRTKDLSTIIEPVLMLVIGGGVGFFAIAMITPMYSVLDSF